MKKHFCSFLVAILCFSLFGCGQEPAEPAWLPTELDYLKDWVKEFHYTAEGGEAKTAQVIFKTASQTLEAFWTQGDEEVTYTELDPSPGNSTLVLVHQLPTYVELLGQWYMDVFETEDFHLTIGTSARDDFDKLIAKHPAMVCKVTNGTFHTLEEGYSPKDLYGLAHFTDSEGKILQLVILEGEIIS